MSFMWKRDVACLRGFSSVFAHHGTAWKTNEPSRRPRRVIGTSYDIGRQFMHTNDSTVNDGGAIGQDEFLEALQKVLPLDDKRASAKPVGLAVSGGVDSMALATLYANCKRPQLPKLHGIIIDHKARPESTEEAQWVAEQLSICEISRVILDVYS